MSQSDFRLIILRIPYQIGHIVENDYSNEFRVPAERTVEYCEQPLVERYRKIIAAVNRLRDIFEIDIRHYGHARSGRQSKYVRSPEHSQMPKRLAQRSQ